MALNKWTQYSIRKQFICSHGIIITLSLLSVWAIMTAYIFSVTDKIVTKFENKLTNDVISNTQFTATDNSDLFIAIMNKNTYGFLYPYLYSTEISLEPIFNLEKIEGYFEYGYTYLAKPLTFDPNYNDYVSLVHSSFKTPYLYPSNVTNLNSSTISLINYTMHSDEIIRVSYQNYEDIESVYSGFENSGLYLRYPAINTLLSDPNRTYDPRTRSWYIEAMRNNNVIYTDPFLGFNTKKWKITIAKKIYANNSAIGVAGANMRITKITNIINNINILKYGKVSLLTSSGIVIVDKEWDENSTNLYTYRDLKNPPINDFTWGQITNQIQGIYNVENYKMTANKIFLANKVYYLIMTIPTEEITKPINNIINSISDSKNNTIIIISVSSICIIILTILLIIYMSNEISSSIQKLCENSKKIVNNLGKDNLFEGVETLNNKEKFLETYKLEKEFNSLVSQLREADNSKNIYYNNDKIFEYPIVEANHEPTRYITVTIPVGQIVKAEF